MGKQAVIFDMDGVIIDSECFWQHSQIDVLAKLGIAITVEECEQFTKGKRIDDIARLWCERYALNVAAPLLEEQIISQVCNAISTRGLAMSGLYQALKSFKASGYRLALATSSCQQVIEAVFDRLNLWQWFEVICSADDETFGKPHPAVYRKAMLKLGLEASDCWVIEDSYTGFLAAHRAEIKTFVVAPDCLDEKFSTAAGRYPTLTDLTDDLNLKLQPALA